MQLSEAATARLTQAGLNLIQQALSIYDADLKLVVSNAPFKEMFDLPESLVTRGADFEDTIRFLTQRGEYGEVDDIEELVRDRVQTALAFEPHYVERTRSNGKVVSIEGSPLPQGGWVTVYTDITEIRRQEEMLRSRSETLSDQLLSHAERLSQTNRELAATNAALEQTKRELTEIEARTRMTAEMMPAHIARIDLSGHYTYSNRRLSSIMPGRPSNILGLHIREALGDDSYAKVLPHLNQAYKGTPSAFEVTHEESSRRIRVVFTPDLQQNEICGVYILSMDVTEEAQARAALIQTNKREMAAKLTSGLAHDFANLLTIILGMQSRLERMDLPAEAREMIAGTRSAAHRGGTLLDRIAQMSGQRAMRPTATDISGFLGELQTLASPTLPEDVTLSITTSGLENDVLIDKGSLQDSLLNLVLNAKDAIGTTRGGITIAARNIRDTWLEFQVSDTGSGFSDEALKHALDPFFTTKGGEGSGLGLSMVYDLTKLAGGQVFLSNSGHGATVTLRLPLRPATPTIDPTLVLLVEDSPEIRQSVREMLTGLGHSVIEAETAEEGNTLARLPGIGLVLSDILLSGGRTGADMLDALLSDGVSPPMRLMTSLPETDPVRVQAAARFPILSKPFSAPELAAFLAAEFAS